MGGEGMRQRAKEMADKLLQKRQAESSKARHKGTSDRGKLIETQMRKLQERRHRGR